MKNDDIKFVNSLYNAANEDISYKVNYLFIVIIAIVILLLVWANIAKIDELTSGQGKVIPSTKIQKVQYFDGGIISEILIKEGDIVKKGQELLKIDTTRFLASYEETQEIILSLKTQKIRLKKELTLNYKNSLPTLKFPKQLLGDTKSYTKQLTNDAKSYKRVQQRIFKNKFYERKNTLKIIGLQQKQKEQELIEIISKKEQLEESLKLIKEQFKTIKKMVKAGSKSKFELINIKKEYTTLKGDLASAILSIPRSKLAIEESTTQIQEKLQIFRSEISIELQETVSELKKTEARLVSDTDKLEKTIIQSPVDGTIKQININTIGSVVQSGVDLIEIVPHSKILFIEAKIDPKDIAFINPTLKVIVKLTAYDFSIYGGLEGKIVEISADSIKDTDSQDNKSYYKIVVKTTKNYIEYNGKKLTIIPGMIASVDIVTGRKTIMDFFLKPILKVKERALHER
ncbi:MAG: HlyD family type I secretion periplasmic adaptor subunit [Arcobacteraceae bacterium]|nr:HlyD family type I secretion periplasmic adaptor subunit [Arcobacteraceae bacterium]